MRPERLEPAPQDIIMLLGQNLCGCHERGLISRFNRKKHRCYGDDCFSGADIALQQTVHWVTRRKVPTNFRDYFHLRTR